LLQFSVSPLELAIETLDETNQKIKSQIDQHLADPTLKVDPLGMILNGVVDAAVNGGIANYKVNMKFCFFVDICRNGLQKIYLMFFFSISCVLNVCNRFQANP
jgi:Dock homology region 2